MKFINIVDPIFSKNNLGKSISKHNYFRLKKVFSYQKNKLDQMYVQAETKGGDHLFQSMLDMFKSSLESNSVVPLLSLKLP